MGFLKRLRVVWTLLGAVIGGGLVVAPGIAGAWTFDQSLGIWRDRPASSVTPNEAKPPPAPAQGKAKAPLPTPIVERTPSNVEIVNKALNPGASDPNIPLPRADLSDGSEPSPASGAPPNLWPQRGWRRGFGAARAHSGRSQRVGSHYNIWCRAGRPGTGQRGARALKIQCCL